MSKHFSRAKISSATSEVREWKSCLKAASHLTIQCVGRVKRAKFRGIITITGIAGSL